MIQSNWLWWTPRQRKTFYLCMLTVGFGAVILAGCMAKAWHQYKHYAYPAFGDFFPLWSYAKIASTQAVTDLYDFGLIHTRQVALGMDPTQVNPFPYAPTALLLFWPLTVLPYELSYVVWMLATLMLFMVTINRTCSRSLLCLIGVLTAPVAAHNVLMGQTGFLTGALMIAGIMLLDTRPVLSGLFIGLLFSFKPQIALLLPIALIAGRNWRVMSIACVTMTLMAVAATMIFGWSVWSAWLAHLPAYSAWFDYMMLADGRAQYMPTVTANLKMLGLSSVTTQAVQALTAISVAALIYSWFRRGRSKFAVAALLVGTFLATPHAVLYDAPMLLGAMVLFIEGIRARRPAFSIVDITTILLIIMLPIAMVMIDGVPISSVPLLVAFCRIMWLDFELKLPRLSTLVTGAAPTVRFG
jgi:hypothetical protein